MINRSTIGISLPIFKAVLALFLFFPAFVLAQAVNQVYIYPGASLVAHPNANLNIFSDISHSGSLTSYNSSFINFYASIWQNNNGSRLPDESARGIDGTGGIFTFSDLLQNAQCINNINSLPFNGFPNLRLDNSLNVLSDLGNLHVNNNLDFRNGYLILNGFDVNVGRPGTGTITGNGQNNRYDFSSTLDVKNLSPGLYEVCFTIATESTFKQCFEIIVTEPKDLALYSFINKEDNKLNFKLEGSDT